MPLTIANLVFRNTTVDFTGKPGNVELTSLEGDYNNFKLGTAIVDLQNLMDAVGAGISSIDQTSATQFTITLSDASVYTLTMPTATVNGRGLWLPNVNYAVNDLLYYGSAFYSVPFAHLSEATFDPGANDGMGNNYYDLAFDLSEAGAAVRQSTYKVEANATHALTFVDPGAIWDCTNVAGCVVTIVDDVTWNFPIDTEISFRQATVGGVVSFVTAGGATLDTGIFLPVTTFHGAVVTIKKRAANDWFGWGYLSA